MENRISLPLNIYTCPALATSGAQAFFISGMTYTVTFEVTNQTDKDKTAYKVELLAGQTVVGITMGSLAAHETLQADCVVVSSKQNNQNLGEKLSIRLLLSEETNEAGRVVFENIKFKEASSSPTPSSAMTAKE